MYHHILIELNEKHPNSSHHIAIYELDIASFDQVVQDVTIPYIKGDTFEFDGRFISQSNIERFKVFRSNNDSNNYVTLQQISYREKRIAAATSRHELLYRNEFVTDITKEVFKIAQKAIGSVSKPTHKMDMSTQSTTQVFIVHGHDELAKAEVARFIEQLGLKPIILHEQANKGKTIIEKIEAHTNVGFAIVLFTPCDVGTNANLPSSLRPRARQNVVFEHGNLIGKLRRERVCALVKGDIELPTDMAGIVYTPMDAHKGWHVTVAKELKAIGYDIDLNKIIG